MRFLTWETGQWTRQSSTVFEVELQTPNTHTHTHACSAVCFQSRFACVSVPSLSWQLIGCRQRMALHRKTAFGFPRIHKYVPRDDLEVAHAVEEIVRVLTLVAGLGTANGGACEKHISFFECIPSTIVPSLS